MSNDNQRPGNSSHNNGHYNGYGPAWNGASSPQNNNPFNNKSDDDEIDLTHIFRILWYHKWLVISATVICSILGYLYAETVTPTYETQGTLMIKSSQNRYSMTGSDIGNLLSSTYGLGVGSTVANELEILKSYSLSKEIAVRLLEEKQTPDGKIYTILFKSSEDSSLAETKTVAKRIQEKLQIKQDDQDNDMVKLSFASSLPYEAMRITNLAMEVYSDFSTKQNRKSASAATNFLQNERQHLRNELQQAEDSLRSFMNKNNLMQVDAQTTMMIDNISSLEKSRQEIKVKLVAVKSGIETYNESLNKIRPGLADQFSNAVGPKLQRFQFQLAELETEKLLLMTENPDIANRTPVNPELKRLNEKIDYVQSQIDNLTEQVLSKGEMYASFLTEDQGGSIASQITELNQKLLELKIQEEQYESQFEVITSRLEELNQYFESLPDKMMDLAQLKRQAKISEELFLMISRQTAETTLWEQTQFGLGRVIDQALYPEIPSAPQKKLYIVIGFLLGGVLSFGFIFLKEMFNTKIDGVEKLRARNYPVLAVIPDQDGNKQDELDPETGVANTLITFLNSLSPNAESIRRLHNNIVLSHPDEQFKTLMVTSPSQGDGKSTTTCNLAVIMAEAGNRVLLIDLDLRRPNTYRIMGVNRGNGLSEILFGKISLEEAIKSTPVENVDILTSGQSIPNPAAVTKSKGLHNLLKKIQQSGDYDHILLDTPPFGVISDSAPIMRLTDGVVMVCKFDKTEEAQLDQTIDNLEHINARVVGTVLNGFNQSKSSDYYYASTNYNYYSYYQEYNAYHTEKE